jgi:hypothetical protein
MKSVVDFLLKPFLSLSLLLMFFRWLGKRFDIQVPPPVGALLSIIPGLGQIISGYWTRGILLMFFIPSLVAIGYSRIVGEDVEASIFPPSLQTSDLNKAQEQVIVYALLAGVMIAVAYVWNIYDGWVSAAGKPSPARMAAGFIAVSTLVLGAHVTELEIGKAIREVDDVRPRLVQIAWPWDNGGLLTRDIEQLDGVSVWETPCDEDNPEQPEVEGGAALLTISPLCGIPAGQRQTDGSREPGTILSVQGSGFRPGEVAEIVIDPASINEFRVVEGGERLRVNTKEKVAMDKLMWERQGLVLAAQKINPQFQPPHDFKFQEQKLQLKIPIPFKV